MAAMAAHDEIDEELLVALQRIGRLMASRQVASDIAGSAGVELSQQGVQLLRTLHRTGKITVARLAATSQMDVGAVSRQLRVLEGERLVKRSTSPHDGRVVVVQLTAAGSRAAARIREVGLRHLSDSLQGWSAADRHQISELLSRLVSDLQRTSIPQGS